MPKPESAFIEQDKARMDLLRIMAQYRILVDKDMCGEFFAYESKSAWTSISFSTEENLLIYLEQYRKEIEEKLK